MQITDLIIETLNTSSEHRAEANSALDTYREDGDKETLEGTLYNIFLTREPDMGYDRVNREIWEHGLQCVCWDTVMDALLAPNEKEKR